MLAIINEILDFSKIESGETAVENKPFHIRKSIDECLKPLILQAGKKNLTVSKNISQEIPDLLMGDSLRLTQVIINLIGNAIKFTERGEIGFTITLDSKNDESVTLHFAVHDTGIGIPQDKLEMIFNPFSQSDGSLTRKYGGTGLGLSISKQLVELMGGEIWVESEKNKGSTFHFTAILGISEHKSDEIAVSKTEEKKEFNEHKERKSLRILLAEDNLMNQEVAKEFLLFRGHSVVAVTTGIEAVELVKKDKFDCVLMDAQMPEMDGLEATAQIREFEKTTGSHIPIIAMTAHAMSGAKEKFIKAGMDDYVSKPFQADELFEKIEKLSGT